MLDKLLNIKRLFQVVVYTIKIFKKIIILLFYAISFLYLTCSRYNTGFIRVHVTIAKIASSSRISFNLEVKYHCASLPPASYGHYRSPWVVRDRKLFSSTVALALFLHRWGGY